MEENIESINIKNNIEGKDYSIGSDSYIIKTINKDFIDSIKNNNDIPDDIKNKYFNVCFDTKNEKEFLLRPDENMDENNFFRDISNYIPEEDYQKKIVRKLKQIKIIIIYLIAKNLVIEKLYLKVIILVVFLKNRKNIYALLIMKVIGYINYQKLMSNYFPKI